MDITWRALYDDNTMLCQVGSDGSRHGYKDIDRGRLLAFDLWNGDQLLVRVDLRDDSGDDVGKRRLIWRMRNEIDSMGNQSRIHMVGWQRTVKGRNVQAICYVFDNGAVMLGGQFRENDSLMYNVVPYEFE